MKLYVIPRRAALALLSALVCTSGYAQQYPNKPVRLIVPYTAGGGADSTTRLIAPKLSERIGQQVVVENRGGGGGNIGAGIAARSPADGYTMLLASAALSASVSLFEKLPFDALKDFTAVSLLAQTPSLVAVHPSMPIATLKDLVAMAKARPGTINYAGGDVASLLHLQVEYLKATAKIDLTRVPYNGSGPSMIGVLAGEAALIMAPAIVVLPHVKSGRLKPLATSGRERAASLPKVPTVAESGYPGFATYQWYGILAPSGTPDPVLDRLNGELAKIMQTQELKARLANEESIAVGGSRDAFAAYFKEDIARWADVLKASRTVRQ